MIHVQPEDDLLALLKHKVDATIAELSAILKQEGPLLDRKSELSRELAVWVEAVKAVLLEAVKIEEALEADPDVCRTRLTGRGSISVSHIQKVETEQDCRKKDKGR